MSDSLSNDESVSVLPRILDPSMKFTVDSIKNFPSRTNSCNSLKGISQKNKSHPSQFEEDKQNNVCIDNNSLDNNQNKFSLFFSNYKYIILTIVIIILVGIIIYLLYKYFSKNKLKDNNEISSNNQKDSISEETKEKINEYVSSYILDEEDENNEENTDKINLNDNTNINESDNNDVEHDNNESDNTNNDIITSHINEIRENIALPQQFNLIIQDDIKLSNDINIDNRFQEISDENLELIDKNKLIQDSHILSTNNNDNYDILSDKNSDTNMSLDLNNIINEIESNNEPENNNEPESINDNKKQTNDIEYFKKFITKDE